MPLGLYTAYDGMGILRYFNPMQRRHCIGPQGRHGILIPSLMYHLQCLYSGVEKRPSGHI